MDRHQEELSATKQLWMMRDLYVTSLVGVRRTVVGIDVVNGVVLSQTPVIYPLGIGIHTFAKWHVGRN